MTPDTFELINVEPFNTQTCTSLGSINSIKMPEGGGGGGSGRGSV